MSKNQKIKRGKPKSIQQHEDATRVSKKKKKTNNQKPPPNRKTSHSKKRIK